MLAANGKPEPCFPFLTKQEHATQRAETSAIPIYNLTVSLGNPRENGLCFSDSFHTSYWLWFRAILFSSDIWEKKVRQCRWLWGTGNLGGDGKTRFVQAWTCALPLLFSGAAKVQHELRWSSGTSRSSGCNVGFAEVSQWLYASDFNNRIWCE